MQNYANIEKSFMNLSIMKEKLDKTYGTDSLWKFLKQIKKITCIRKNNVYTLYYWYNFKKTYINHWLFQFAT